jgi:hypothetical protein
MAHVAHFLAEPLTEVPTRRADSLRRTSSVDMVRRGDGDLALLGLAHDDVGGSAACTALVAPDRTLRSIDVSDELSGLSGLLGRLVGRGFRGAVDEVVEPGTLASVLLCELPVAALLAGYGSLYTDEFPTPISDTYLAGLPVNVCAGWTEPGSMMRRIRGERTIPTPDGPTAPLGIDAAWHPMAALAPGSMRRQRLIQRDGEAVWAMFRDTYARPDGRVIVLHEYSLEATLIGGVGGRSEVATCAATPRVLPWLECPQAAASAQRVEGHPVAGLRALVKDELVGTSICTHLNDLLASLSQADALVR